MAKKVEPMVDFQFRNYPRVIVASLVRRGPWREENLRSEFAKLTSWARSKRLRTGRWIFYERGEDRWEACLEVKGRLPRHGEGKIRLRSLPAARVASVVFNPEKLSPRVVYHGLIDWLRWRRKEGEIKRVVSSREVYADDPWKNPAAWARADVQFIVKR